MYCAVKVCVPAFSFAVAKVAFPPVKATVPRTVAPSMNATLPEMVPATLELTDAVNVTVWPKRDGFKEDERFVVVDAVFTVCVVVPELAR